MTLKNLKKLLIEKGIPKRAYFLSGGLPSECYCLNKTKGVWEVYYSERGNKSSLKTFDRESEACNCLLNWMRKDYHLSRYFLD